MLGRSPVPTRPNLHPPGAIRGGLFMSGLGQPLLRGGMTQACLGVPGLLFRTTGACRLRRTVIVVSGQPERSAMHHPGRIRNAAKKFEWPRRSSGGGGDEEGNEGVTHAPLLRSYAAQHLNGFRGSQSHRGRITTAEVSIIADRRCKAVRYCRRITPSIALPARISARLISWPIRRWRCGQQSADRKTIGPAAFPEHQEGRCHDSHVCLQVTMTLETSTQKRRSITKMSVER